MARYSLGLRHVFFFAFAPCLLLSLLFLKLSDSWGGGHVFFHDPAIDASQPAMVCDRKTKTRPQSPGKIMASGDAHGKCQLDNPSCRLPVGLGRLLSADRQCCCNLRYVLRPGWVVPRKKVPKTRTQLAAGSIRLRNGRWDRLDETGGVCVATVLMKPGVFAWRPS